MADNYLITGYWGEPHVTAENDRGINAAMFGTGRFVLPVGEQFRAEYIGNNTIRMYDGKLMDNGAAAGIPVGEYVDLLIANAGQGMNRNDLIVFQYKQDASTLIESGTFVVIQGEESSGTASDPALTQEDLLSGEAAFDQMALWRVPVSGTAISAPVKLFSNWGGYAPATESTDHPGCYYHIVDGVTEWVNPPLVLFEEYRTTERWNGKVVYTMLFDFGAMPASKAAKQVSLPDGLNPGQIIRCEGSSAADVAETFPAYSEGPIIFFARQDNVRCENWSSWDMSYFGAKVQIWYTKD